MTKKYFKSFDIVDHCRYVWITLIDLSRRKSCPSRAAMANRELAPRTLQRGPGGRRKNLRPSGRRAWRRRDFNFIQVLDQKFSDFNGLWDTRKARRGVGKNAGVLGQGGGETPARRAGGCPIRKNGAGRAGTSTAPRHGRKCPTRGGALDWPQRRTTAVKSGTVKYYNAERGFGFIKPDDGSPDLFFPVKAAGVKNR
jgi:hypothetical protein